MITKRFRICSLFDIPIYVDFTFLFIILLSLGNGLSYAISLTAVLAVSIVAHELGHSLTAKLYGCPTYDITLSVLGGCASLTRLPRTAGGEVSIALAGPAVSFVLSAMGFVMFSCLTGTAFENICFTVFALNLMLCVFNLLPGFPMDGGRILRGCLEKFLGMYRAKATYYAMNVGRVFAAIFAAVGLIELFNGCAGGITNILISVFIWKAGEAEYFAACRGY